MGANGESGVTTPTVAGALGGSGARGICGTFSRATAVSTGGSGTPGSMLGLASTCTTDVGLEATATSAGCMGTPGMTDGGSSLPGVGPSTVYTPATPVDLMGTGLGA